MIASLNYIFSLMYCNNAGTMSLAFYQFLVGMAFQPRKEVSHLLIRFNLVAGFYGLVIRHFSRKACA
jgi:hypothetical protein